MSQAGPAVLQEIDDLSVRWDYASATIRYQGHASPGASEGSAVWRIKRLTFDSSGRHIKTELAGGAANFNQIWSNRTTLVYS